MLPQEGLEAANIDERARSTGMQYAIKIQEDKLWVHDGRIGLPACDIAVSAFLQYTTSNSSTRSPMSKSSARRRVGQPRRAVPRVSNHRPLVPEVGLDLRELVSPPQARRHTLIVSTTVCGITINRYQGWCEVIDSTGRAYAAATPLGVLVQMLKGGIK